MEFLYGEIEGVELIHVCGKFWQVNAKSGRDIRLFSANVQLMEKFVKAVEGRTQIFPGIADEKA